MAIGNNSNKKKKIIVRTKPDPYLRKEWYNVKAPPMFKHNDIGQTPVLKTAGLRVASEVIKGRIYESNLGDLAENEAVNGNIKFYFKAVETKDNSSLTDFYGYSITRHKLQSLFRKRCSKIDSVVDVQTKDGYLLRVFAIAFTDKDEKSYSQNCYAKTSQKRNIRRIMASKIVDEIKSCDVKEVMSKLANQAIDEKMATAAPENIVLRNVCIQRIKLINTPKYDAKRIADLHSGTAMDFGKRIDRKE